MPPVVPTVSPPLFMSSVAFPRSKYDGVMKLPPLLIRVVVLLLKMKPPVKVLLKTPPSTSSVELAPRFSVPPVQSMRLPALNVAPPLKLTVPLTRLRSALSSNVARPVVSSVPPSTLSETVRTVDPPPMRKVEVVRSVPPLVTFPWNTALPVPARSWLAVAKPESAIVTVALPAEPAPQSLMFPAEVSVDPAPVTVSEPTIPLPTSINEPAVMSPPPVAFR